MSTLLASLHEKINAATSRNELDGILQSIWRCYWPGQLSDTDAQFLTDAIESRKPGRGALSAKPIAALNRRAISCLTQRKCRERRTDEDRAKRRNRKRMLGGSSALPDSIRHHFTEGERAVGCVVAGECKRKGYCDLSIDEIADRAGVGRTTVQNYQHQAQLLVHVKIQYRPQRGAKSLTNVITIISTEWLAWIRRAPNAAWARDRVQLSKNVNTSKRLDLRKTEAWQGRCAHKKEYQVEPPYPERSQSLSSREAPKV